MGSLSLLQEILPTQGSNLHCSWMFYQLSHQGSLLRTDTELNSSTWRNKYIKNKHNSKQNPYACYKNVTWWQVIWYHSLITTRKPHLSPHKWRNSGNPFVQSLSWYDFSLQPQPMPFFSFYSYSKLLHSYLRTSEPWIVLSVRYSPQFIYYLCIWLKST